MELPENALLLRGILICCVYALIAGAADQKVNGMFAGDEIGDQNATMLCSRPGTNNCKYSGASGTTRVTARVRDSSVSFQRRPGPLTQMPTGTPYNSFVLPYHIRVDNFATQVTQETTPVLHLLTHTHSDHINGLSATSFGYQVICSYDAKEMLLRHEVYAERELHEMDLRAEKTRTYSHLKVDPRVQADGTTYYTGSRDLLVCTVLSDAPRRSRHFATRTYWPNLRERCAAPLC